MNNNCDNNYAVFGNPIAHSKSPEIHALFAEQENVKIQYDRILIENPDNPDNFAQAMHDFFINHHGLGANITVPFKTIAYQWVTELSPRAKAAGAVNTIIPLKNPDNQDNQDNQNISFLGDNTDGVGLVKDITENLNFSIENKKILIIGAGGATRGVILPLLEKNPNQLMITNRTYSKALELSEEFNIQAQELDNLNNLNNLDNLNFDLIINATSSGLAQEIPNISPNIFTQSLKLNPNLLVYDMFYSNKMTTFLQFAQANGVRNLADGLGMLVCQAAYSYELWRGFQPETSSVIDKMRTLLS